MSAEIRVPRGDGSTLILDRAKVEAALAKDAVWQRALARGKRGWRHDLKGAEVYLYRGDETEGIYVAIGPALETPDAAVVRCGRYLAASLSIREAVLLERHRELVPEGIGAATAGVYGWLARAFRPLFVDPHTPHLGWLPGAETDLGAILTQAFSLAREKARGEG